MAGLSACPAYVFANNLNFPEHFAIPMTHGDTISETLLRYLTVHVNEPKSYFQLQTCLYGFLDAP